MKKYIIAFLLPHEYDQRIRVLMEEIARISDTEPLYNHMVPHITLHRPIAGISYEKILNLAKSVVLRLRASRIRISGVDCFGEKYIVLPVQLTQTTAAMWVGVHDLLSQVPEYGHGDFDHDNTLHITLAKDLKSKFSETWENIILQKQFTESFDIPITHIGIYGKNQTTGDWELVESLELPEK